MQPELNEKRFGMVPAQRVEAFYLAYHKYLRDNGVDGVKVRIELYMRMSDLSLFFTDHERDFSCSGLWRRAGQLGYCSMHPPAHSMNNATRDVHSGLFPKPCSSVVQV